eukprot:768006-Hanusia_phi.AAC.3
MRKRRSRFRSSYSHLSSRCWPSCPRAACSLCTGELCRDLIDSSTSARYCQFTSHIGKRRPSSTNISFTPSSPLLPHKQDLHLRKVPAVTVRNDAVSMQSVSSPATNADVLLARHVVLVSLVSSAFGLESQPDGELSSLHAAASELVQGCAQHLKVSCSVRSDHMGANGKSQYKAGKQKKKEGTDGNELTCKVVVDVPKDSVDLDVA